jgi:hypothetical protein
MYRYLGRNGIITSPILLENIAPIPLYELRAAAGKVLTDGTQFVKVKTVFEDELNNWTEIDDPNI